ncbi:PRTRC system protein B [uncultured Flavobacterium sp.]|uniref:PRTRC system protein B n=1 Tax=uncultured Flavobacterium sp. TaxID=165435 RepID=UPI002600281F|nr:PRTRC system protein B [uncultured Flavobacterium sp.]
MKTQHEIPTLYHPAAALVVFKPEDNEGGLYIEHYDMDSEGCPVNPRPLTVREAQSLSKALDTRKAAVKAFLKPQGIIPAKVLHINPAENGSVVWYTKPQRRKLHFTENLIAPMEAVALPALVWVADRKRLSVFAIKAKGKPSLATTLFNAPFFNIYHNGNVCMGSVDVRISASASLEQFIAAWEEYFFGSYFSHFVQGHQPINGNLISLFQELAQTGDAFPSERLIPINRQLKHLLP